MLILVVFFFFSSRRRHTRFDCDWSSDVCSSDLRKNSLHAVQQCLRGLRTIKIVRVLRSPRIELNALPAGRQMLMKNAERFPELDRKSTRLNSSHSQISYAVFCLKKKKERKST